MLDEVKESEEEAWKVLDEAFQELTEVDECNPDKESSNGEGPNLMSEIILERVLTPPPDKKEEKLTLQGICRCSFCVDKKELLASPEKPKCQTLSVIKGEDKKIRGIALPKWKMPIWICVEHCVFNLISREGEKWFQKVEVRPYEGRQWDIL